MSAGITTTADAEPQEPEPRLWPYKAINVSGLFGIRNYPMSLDPLLTIVTGENGSGKSTVLRAIDQLSHGHWAALHSLPLDRIELVFADDSSLAAANTETGLVVSGRGEPWEIELPSVNIPDPRRRHEAMLLRRELEAGSLPRARAAMLQRRLAEFSASDLDVPPWVSQTLAQIETKLISARRLEHRLRPDRTGESKEIREPAVDGFAGEMRDRMRVELARYAAESQQQEKTLPSRIVHAMQEGTAEDSEEIALDVDRLRAEVRELADLLARVGLFDEEEDPDQQFEGYPRDNANILLAVREVYRVARDRLSRLSNLRSDLDLFATFLNQRFTQKRIDLNPNNGIDVVLPSGNRIRPSQLSSGEQQLLALAYELLFGTGGQSVVLLDEPELSLHVGWLKGLIAAFMDMGRHRELQYVIATHSPSILTGHLERERSLDLA